MSSVIVFGFSSRLTAKPESRSNRTSFVGQVHHSDNFHLSYSSDESDDAPASFGVNFAVFYSRRQSWEIPPF
jgi:hypothetical protein